MELGDAYEVRRELARDERGLVLEAWDRRHRRAVALKVLRDPGQAARFRGEIRAATELVHPSIPPLYEAGRCRGGEPYYAMRLVEGETLAALAAAAPEPLTLVPHLVAVAAALAYAHERGWGHGGVRATHVLVGQFGETMLIGWGNASPGGDVGADVEALGALIAEVLGPRIPAELRAVSQRARDPARRYPSARELTEDLAAFTTGRVVSAMAASPGARLRRWIGRHRRPLILALAATGVLGVLGGAFVAGMVRERDRAAVGSQAAAALVDWLLDGLRARLEGVGRLDALAELGGEIERYIGALSSDADAQALVRLADAWTLVGDAARAAGDLEGAQARLVGARSLYERALAKEPAHLEARRGLCAAIGTAGDLELQRARSGPAEAAFRASIDCLREGSRQHPRYPRLRRSLATVWWRLAAVAEEQGNWAEARGRYLEGRTALEEGVALGGRYEAEAAWLAQALASLARRRGRLAEALAEGERAIAAYRALRAESPGEIELVAELVSALANQGRLAMTLGDWATADGILDEAVRLADTLRAREPRNVEWGYLVADTVSDQCDLALRRELPARELCERALADARTAAAAAPDQRKQRQLVLTAEWMLGREALAAGDLPRARGHAVATREAAERVLALGEASAFARRGRVLADELAGEIELRAGRPALAVARLGEAVTALEALAAETGSDGHRQDVAALLVELGDAQAAAGDRVAAQASHARAHAIALELWGRISGSTSLATLVAKTSWRVGDRAGARAALAPIDDARLEPEARRLRDER